VPVHYPGETADPAASIATDRAGDLWVSTFAPSVLHRVRGIWKNENQELGRKPGVLGAMAGDLNGNVWFAFSNKLVEWDGQTFRRYSFPDGPLNISVFTLAIRNNHVWLAGGAGLVLFRDGRFEPVTWKDPLLPGSISGVVETEDGELWLNGFDGVIKVSRSELAHRLADPSYALTAQRFDTLDGLPGLAGARYPEPSLVESSSGRLWFATSEGIAWLDPRFPRTVKNEAPPPR
jgi:ligand-binding sensor domain-containing protein